MQKYQDVVLKPDGTVIQGASVLVQSYPAGVTSTIYSDDGITTQANPVVTDSLGRFSFYAADGQYQLVITGPSIAAQTITDVQLLDLSNPSFTGVFSADGIKFPEVQVPSSNVNTLDDYEEGTWTPNLTFATPGTQTFVRDPSSYGTYTKIGNRVMCDMFLYYTTFTYSGTSGSARITGLPFAADATYGSCGALSISGGDLGATIRGTFANIGAGATTVTPYFYSQTGDGPMTTTQFPSGSSFIFIRASFVYKV